ncbi:MAG: protein kinase domain-containing protein, partial [Planctomycetota bacterium]
MGNFLIEEKVGAGGMGTVYRGMQEGLERPVAVKILHGARRSPTFLKRFLREAKSAAQVNHPNVVQVYNAGVEDGIHYIAMEFLEGFSVGEILDDKGAFPESEVLDIGKQAATGLLAASRRGLVHRDVKPDNLILDGDAVIKVADFGLAKDVESHSRLTEDKVTIGTIAYMSPEQIKGGEVDRRSDIYALGATLFHIASGRPAFYGDGAVVMAYKHLNEPPPMLRSLRADLSVGLEAVVHRMMAKDRDKRHQSYEELLEDLEALEATGKPSSTLTYKFHEDLLRESGPLQRSRRFLAGLIVGTLGLAGVILLMVNLFGGSNGSGEPLPDPPAGTGGPSGLVIEAPREGAVLSSTKVEVKGTADSENVLSLTINSTRIALVAGRFSHEVWLDPADPRITIEVVRRDGVPEKKVLILPVDREAPQIILDSPPGPVFRTRRPTALIEGRFLDEHPEELLVDGASVPVKDGRFRLEVQLSEDGSKKVRFRGSDKAGHVQEMVITLIRDRKEPTVRLHDFRRFVDGGGGTINLIFEVDEPLSSLRVNGEELEPTGVMHQKQITLKPGRNKVRIEACDL